MNNLGGTLLSDLCGPDGRFLSMSSGSSSTIALSEPESETSLHPVHPSMAHHPDMIPTDYYDSWDKNQDKKSLSNVRDALTYLELELEKEKKSRRKERKRWKKFDKTKKQNLDKKKSSKEKFPLVAVLTTSLALIAIIIALAAFTNIGRKKDEEKSTPSVVYHVYTTSAVPMVQSAMPFNWPVSMVPVTYFPTT